ncbi:MAG: 2-phospho-L-lactate transferase [Ktedonobacterales bacterium]
MIVALAGGVGGAKLAHGLYERAAPGELTIIANTADDFDRYNLRICPDADTILYTLAGLANAETGWGISGDTFETLRALRRYGEDTWFSLGDQDFATHILRSRLLHSGWRLTKVLAAMTSALKVSASILPMSDDPVATIIQTPSGDLAFQDYFVRRQHADEVVGVRFAGIEAATISEETRLAIGEAEVIVLCPSNPIVSIGPILAIPGMRQLLGSAAGPVVAVSPIVSGHALRGPADKMLAGLGYESSSVAVAQLYRNLVDGMVIDQQDASLAPRIEALGLDVLITDSIMSNVGDRVRLAGEVLEFAGRLRRRPDHATRGEE